MKKCEISPIQLYSSKTQLFYQKELEKQKKQSKRTTRRIYQYVLDTLGATFLEEILVSLAGEVIIRAGDGVIQAGRGAVIAG